MSDPHQFGFRIVLFAMLLAFGVSGCQHAKPPHPAIAAAPERAALVGRPSWLPLGPEVYQEDDRDEAEKGLLAFRPQPRWFLGFTKEVSKAEFDQYLDRTHGKAQESDDGGYCLPDPPPYPKRLEDIPLEDQGVRLTLTASVAEEPSTMLLTLTLTSRDKPVRREVEHRWTNTLPLLFAFYVDGKAVVVPSNGFEKFGGVAYMVPLVEKGGTKTWNLKANALSLRSLLPDSRPHELAVAAAFSNRQHEGYFEGAPMERGNLHGGPNGEDRPQVLVRSGAARLKWDGTNWGVAAP